MKQVLFITDDIGAPVNAGLKEAFESAGYKVSHASVAEVLKAKFKLPSKDDLAYGIIDFDSKDLQVDEGKKAAFVGEITRLSRVFPENVRLIAINGSPIEVSKHLREAFEHGRIQHLPTSNQPEVFIKMLEMTSP